MTNFNQGDILLNQTAFINYYLINLKLYTSNIVTSGPSTDGNYHLSYDSTNGASTNNYNAIYYNNPVNPSNLYYNLTDIWLFKPLHTNITGVTDGSKDALKKLIGEIVFETTGSTDSSNKLFLCFLIKSVSSDGTDDEVLKNSGSISKLFNKIIKNPGIDGGIVYSGSDVKGAATLNFSSDGTIPKQDDAGCIIYNDSVNKATVVVYLNPITTSNKQFINFISGTTISGASSTGIVKGSSTKNSKGEMSVSTLFNIYPPDGGTGAGSKQIYSNPSNMPTGQLTSAAATSALQAAEQKLATDSQIYIDCNPTTDLNGDEELAYNIPLNSTLMQDIQHSSVAQLSSNFLFFGMIVFVTYLGVPRFYNMAICDKMPNDADKKSAKAFIMLYLFVVCIALFLDGQNNGNMTELLAGAAMIFFAIFTFLLISSEERKNGINIGFNMPNFIGFIVGVASHLGNYKTTLPMMIALWILLMVILVCLAFIPNMNGQGNNGAIITMDQFRDYFCWIGILVIPTIVGTLTWITT